MADRQQQAEYNLVHKCACGRAVATQGKHIWMVILLIREIERRWIRVAAADCVAVCAG